MSHGRCRLPFPLRRLLRPPPPAAQLDVPWQPTAQYIPVHARVHSQGQDAAQQVLAKLNAVDIAKLANQLSTLLTDAQADLANRRRPHDAGECGDDVRTIDEAVRAADLPALTADIRRTSSALHDTLQGEQLQRPADQCAGLSGRPVRHRGGQVAGADCIGTGDGATRR